jgi:hypothetical protein
MDRLVSAGVDSPAIVGAARELVTRAGAEPRWREAGARDSSVVTIGVAVRR